MNSNKITIIFSVIVIFLLVAIPTTYKVIKNHQKNLIRTTESKIIEAAKKCYFEEKCDKSKIYLKDLYSLKYLEKISNPLTKEFYNEDSYIEIREDKFIFNEKK